MHAAHTFKTNIYRFYCVSSVKRTLCSSHEINANDLSNIVEFIYINRYLKIIYSRQPYVR